MNWETYQLAMSLAVMLGALVFFMRGRLPGELIALSGMALLLMTGVLQESDLKQVFGNTAPLTIGAMFVLSAGLTQTGAVDWLAEMLIGKSKGSSQRFLILLAIIVMPLSAFLNNTPVVVILLPVVMAFCRRENAKPGKLLIPLSFFCILGGTITLIGTSTNLLVDGEARKRGLEPFTLFEITPLGLVYAAVGFLYLFVVGRKLLPDRETVASLIDSEDTRRFSSAMIVTPESASIGKPVSSLPGFEDPKKAILYEVTRNGERLRGIPLNKLELAENDILWFRAMPKQLAAIRKAKGLEIWSRAEADDEQGREVKIVEAIIGPRSPLVGQTIREFGFRNRYGVFVAAIHRQGVNVRQQYQDLPLAFGDTLLLEGPVSNLTVAREECDFLNLNENPLHTELPASAPIALTIMAAVVLVAAFGIIPITSAALIGALALILTKCLSLAQAYRSIEWNILFLIYGMLGIGQALDNSGGAAWLANIVITLTQESPIQHLGPIAILAAIYLLASVLTEMVTNNAVAILLPPVVIPIAAALDVDPRPFIVAIMFGASASFMTPIGYQTNTYVYGAGGYQFGDFMKIGIPLNLILWVLATLLIPIFWPF
ncbi:MAG: SLC13 family permease [Verrucomicrobiota bacterium JB023]|nr:SLC13 family permease [Verrucomicrobiota bacterium JB023]